MLKRVRLSIGMKRAEREGTTLEMHYSWGVRRYDMIQYVARPYLLTARETAAREGIL